MNTVNGARCIGAQTSIGGFSLQFEADGTAWTEIYRANGQHYQTIGVRGRDTNRIELLALILLTARVLRYTPK